MPDRSAENLARIRACDAEWDESKHSRADNGQFTSGGGGGGAKPIVTTKAGGVSSVTGGGSRGQLHITRKGTKQYVWLQSTKKDGSFGKPIAYEVGKSPEETLKRMQENNPGSKWRFSETEGKYYAR